MAAGLPVSTIIEWVGHDRATDIKDLIPPLQRAGFEIKANRLTLISKRNPIPARAICKGRYKRPNGKWYSSSHWILIWDGAFLDPLGQDHVYSVPLQLSSFLDLTYKSKL